MDINIQNLGWPQEGSFGMDGEVQLDVLVAVDPYKTYPCGMWIGISQSSFQELEPARPLWRVLSRFVFKPAPKGPGTDEFVHLLITITIVIINY